MKPFANEPILELRRAPVRARLEEALREHDARPPLSVPVWIGEDQREGEELVSTDPGNPERVVATAAKATAADVDAALQAAERGSKAWAATPAQERAEILRARRAVAARAPARGRGAGRARVREAVARGRRGRLRGDRLPRVLRPRRARHRPGRARCCRCPGEKNTLSLRAARGRRRHLAVELPGRDPARHGRRGPRDRQRRRAQARRAVARLRADALPRAARGRRAARRGLAAARRGRRRRRAGPGPARAHDRLHRLGRRRAGDRPRGRPGAPGPAAPQARDRRDGRQELRDRRLRRRPRRGRARAA